MGIARALSTVVGLALAMPAPLAGQETISLPRADGVSLRLKVFAAASGACRGIAILSHGGGGSEEGLGYLARALSEDGYLAAVIGHPTSGRSDSAAYRGRLMDVAAARAW
ncbi:MAG: hypothetical protein ACYC3L_17160, partial [Gemmatimonadaceae bacterium]